MMMNGYGTPKLANEYSGACGSHGLPVETMVIMRCDDGIDGS